MPLPKQLIECIVNVSEGRDLDVLNAITQAIDSVPDCFLLHRDVGESAHRTVFTFAGTPAAVFEAAFLIYKVSADLIDMQIHQGAHPRLGAVDVCPFVPIKNVKMPDLVARTLVLGERVGKELGIPVFLYEESATADHRRNLASIRKGEYEGLSSKTREEAWKPDFGPDYHAKFGATVLGARPFLIAWNINLAPDVPLSTAKTLARKLRGSGFQGKPGMFPHLKAIGWYLENFQRCQVSCNVVNADKTDLTRVYLTAVNLASELGATVTGSELIGLVPEKYLLKAGRSFCFSDDKKEQTAAAISVLGLNDLGPFIPEKRILELALQQKQ